MADILATLVSPIFVSSVTVLLSELLHANNTVAMHSTINKCLIVFGFDFDGLNVGLDQKVFERSGWQLSGERLLNVQKFFGCTINC